MAKKKKKRTKGLFMKLVVIFCIAYVVRVVENGMTICEQQSISPAQIVTAAIAFFGAELGLCAVKRIWAKEDNTESEEKVNNDKIDKEVFPLNNDFKLPLE